MQQFLVRHTFWGVELQHIFCAVTDFRGSPLLVMYAAPQDVTIESIRPVGQLYNSPLPLSGPMMFVYELSIQITSQ